ncbi:hypothetical protein K9L63_03720 [Candidatus Gracilibacteria bacterium]|nr:hypothetical protein [Candidatus Gracilibacteria bacterium]
MKKIFVLAVLAVFFGLSFGGQSEAARNISGRFRGRDYDDFLKYKEALAEKTLPKYSSLRRFDRIPVPNPSVVSQVKIAQPTSASRRFTTQGFSAPSPTSSSASREVQEFRDHSASKVSFRLTVPKDFNLRSDTLTWDSGSLLFQQGNSKIEVIATPQKCEGGLTFVRSCLEQKSEAFLGDFKQELPRMQLQENKNISLNQNEVQLGRDNMARHVRLSSWNYEASQLTFFDPVNKYVWLLRIIDPGKETGIVSDNRSLQRMFSSILSPFESSSDTSNADRTVLSYLFGARNRSTGNTQLSKTPIRYDSSQVGKIGAESIPFTLETPNGFKLANDTLSWNEGELVLESDDSSFRIVATDFVCDEQTPRLKRECIERYAVERGKELKAEFPGANILQDQNMQLQLVDRTLMHDANMSRTTFSRDYVGRMLLLRMPGKRVGLLTFAEPIHNFLWTVRIEAPEERDAFLNDIRQKQKIFSSLQFHPTEEDLNWEPSTEDVDVEATEGEEE